ncbi:hypothetical protein CCZ27_19615 [Thauera sinica]|nr:hypothetical protein CCZ27_19615 [Thauera sp. K11]
MAKKDAGASTLLVGVAIVVGIIAAIPKEVWDVILAVGVVALVFWTGTKVIGAEKSHRPDPSPRGHRPRPHERCVHALRWRVSRRIRRRDASN